MTRNHPVFSIIIPAYNKEKGIATTLKGVIQQDFPKNQYEIIVVNNNSRDQTKAIAQKFPVKVVDENKQGYVFALRKGCLEAQGKIIIFTDADTIVPKDWLAQYQKAYQDPKIICAGGGANFQPKFGLFFLIEAFLNFFGRVTKIASGFNFSIRRATYQQLGGFNPQINFHTDTDLILRTKKEGQVVFLPKNKVITSSRHYHEKAGIIYVFKGIINALWLFLFKKTIFYKFGNIR